MSRSNPPPPADPTGPPPTSMAPRRRPSRSGDCLVYCCCPIFANCQEAREIKIKGTVGVSKAQVVVTTNAPQQVRLGQ